MNKHSLKALLLEDIHPIAQEKLNSFGFSVEALTKTLPEDELITKLKDCQVLGVRSKTHITEKVLDASQLLAIGTFCIGTDKVDLACANRRGIPVFNAPYGNTRSVAELIISEIIALSRKLFLKSSKLHEKVWDKNVQDACEVRGKTLGIVGYGHIGSQVGVLAESLGLNVIYYDIITKLPFGNAKPANSLDEVLKNSDFVTLHVPHTEKTKNLISKKELSLMKPTAHLLNASRGTVVDLKALSESIKNKKIAGAAVDVFEKEPQKKLDTFECELQGLDNVILTPHIGGNTQEAHFSIGNEVSESLIRFVKEGSSLGALNFPKLAPPSHQESCRFLNVHKNIAGALKGINDVIFQLEGNILNQYLSTDGEIGYVITETNKDFPMEKAIENIQTLPYSISTRACL